MRVTKDPRIDAYLAGLPPKARAALRKIRAVLRRLAPTAQETISYRMPAYRGHGMILYFAAFEHHIGLFPPVRGDGRLNDALARYRGPKGNLRFPLDTPLPMALIERVAKVRVTQDRRKSMARARRRPGRASAR